MKCVIYVRTSTVEQFPEKQLESCRRFAISRGYDVGDEYIEQLSAFKDDVKRPLYEIIKDKAHSGEINAVIVWALDRWVRNRDTLLEDVTYLRDCGVKLHSVNESWLEAINIEGALGRTIQDFLLGLIGTLAEMESKRKSDRVKMAFESYKKEDRVYKKWGRSSLPDRVTNKIIELYNGGLSMRKIAEHPDVYYYDKNNNKKNVSIGSVHKTIKQIP